MTLHIDTDVFGEWITEKINESVEKEEHAEGLREGNPNSEIADVYDGVAAVEMRVLKEVAEKFAPGLQNLPESKLQKRTRQERGE